MAVNIWKFHVREGHAGDFVRMNQEDWPKLFGLSPGYLGGGIGRNTDDPNVYVTMDRWTSKKAFDDFLGTYGNDFETLDALHKEHYESSEHIGFFEDPL